MLGVDAARRSYGEYAMGRGAIPAAIPSPAAIAMRYSSGTGLRRDAV
jgi:hypothetical protein